MENFCHWTSPCWSLPLPYTALMSNKRFFKKRHHLQSSIKQWCRGFVLVPLKTLIQARVWWKAPIIPAIRDQAGGSVVQDHPQQQRNLRPVSTVSKLIDLERKTQERIGLFIKEGIPLQRNFQWRIHTPGVRKGTWESRWQPTLRPWSDRNQTEEKASVCPYTFTHFVCLIFVPGKQNTM